MKHLMAWNKCYGCMSFEVFISYGETIEEKKKIYEDRGYYCWICNDDELQKYFERND